MTALKNMDKFLSPQLTLMVKGSVVPCAQGARRWSLAPGGAMEPRLRAAGCGLPPGAAQDWLPGRRPPAAGGAVVPRAERALAAGRRPRTHAAARWWPSRAAA